jgi:DNA-directed RNA polymerase specialized sigma subunit
MTLQRTPKYRENKLFYLDRTPEQNELKNKIYWLLERLEAKKGIRRRIALEQYYFCEKPNKEIGKILHLSRSRIFQMNKQSLQYLAYLARGSKLKDYFLEGI